VLPNCVDKTGRGCWTAHLLNHQSDIAIAREVGLDRLAIRRIRQDPAKAEGALVAWEGLKARPRRWKAA
jgi:hypothetical protein